MIDIVIAFLAPILNCMYQIPQLFQIMKTKSVNDLSAHALFLLLINNILWLLHGYYINDRPLLFSSLTSLAINIPLVCLYVKHRKYHNE
jgi:uncharacterized protein with PQ loop repeat